MRCTAVCASLSVTERVPKRFSSLGFALACNFPTIEAAEHSRSSAESPFFAL